jgi:DedD protein
MSKDDLLDMEPKKDIKKWLIYGAIAFLVFIIVIIGVAIYQNMSSSKAKNQILPNNAATSAPKNTQSQFKPIPVENSGAQNQQTSNNSQAVTQTNNASASQSPSVNNSQNSSGNTQNQQTSAAAKNNSQNVSGTGVSGANQTTQSMTTQPETVKKNAVKSAAPKPKKRTKISSNGKYYIQVAALLRDSKPNKKFVELIKKDGFNYRYYKTFVVKNGRKIRVTKVLIGPFKDRKEALKYLPKVKRDINQMAFIFKVK